MKKKYESPMMEVSEMDTEIEILAGSGEITGNNDNAQQTLPTGGGSSQGSAGDNAGAKHRNSVDFLVR